MEKGKLKDSGKIVSRKAENGSNDLVSDDIPGEMEVGGVSRPARLKEKEPRDKRRSSRIKEVTAASAVMHEEEEQKRLEEQRFEQIAALRRKFKEQHKNILLSLENKNKEEEKRQEELQRLEEEKKRKMRLRADRLLAKRLEFIADQKEAAVIATADEIPTSVTAVRDRSNGVVAAGSGLSVVRATRTLSAKAVGGSSHRYVPAGESIIDSETVGQKGEVDSGETINKAGCEVADSELQQERERKVKRVAAKLHQARVAAYLIALAEQKKKEDDARLRQV